MRASRPNDHRAGILRMSADHGHAAPAVLYRYRPGAERLHVSLLTALARLRHSVQHDAQDRTPELTVPVRDAPVRVTVVGLPRVP